MTGNWSDRLSDAEQDAELEASWVSVCSWAERQGVDRVFVDSFPHEYSAMLVELGFVAPLRRARRAEGLEYVGSPREVADRMRRLFVVPTVFASASVQGIEIVRVEDLSWDSVFLYSSVPPILD